MDYVENTLIKLRREYSRDEVIQALYKKLEEKNIEIGVLNSELDERKYLIKQKFQFDLLTYRVIKNALLNNRESRYKKQARKKSKRIEELNYRIRELEGRLEPTLQSNSIRQ